MEGQKTYAQEEWLPGVEDQLKACKPAAEVLATATQFPQELLEEESDDTFIMARPKPVSPARRLLGETHSTQEQVGVVWIPL